MNTTKDETIHINLVCKCNGIRAIYSKCKIKDSCETCCKWKHSRCLLVALDKKVSTNKTRTIKRTNREIKLTRENKKLIIEVNTLKNNMLFSTEQFKLNMKKLEGELEKRIHKIEELDSKVKEKENDKEIDMNTISSLKLENGKLNVEISTLKVECEESKKSSFELSKKTKEISDNVINNLKLENGKLNVEISTLKVECEESKKSAFELSKKTKEISDNIINNLKLENGKLNVEISTLKVECEESKKSAFELSKRTKEISDNVINNLKLENGKLNVEISTLNSDIKDSLLQLKSTKEPLEIAIEKSKKEIDLLIVENCQYKIKLESKIKGESVCSNINEVEKLKMEVAILKERCKCYLEQMKDNKSIYMNFIKESDNNAKVKTFNTMPIRNAPFMHMNPKLNFILPKNTPKIVNANKIPFSKNLPTVISKLNPSDRIIVNTKKRRVHRNTKKDTKRLKTSNPNADSHINAIIEESLNLVTKKNISDELDSETFNAITDKNTDDFLENLFKD